MIQKYQLLKNHDQVGRLASIAVRELLPALRNRSSGCLAELLGNNPQIDGGGWKATWC